MRAAAASGNRPPSEIRTRRPARKATAAAAYDVAVMRQAHVPPLNRDADSDLALYLASERRAAAWRVLRVGLVALVFGALGSVELWREWTSLGYVARVLLAAPFLVVIGTALTGWGAVARRRASVD